MDNYFILTPDERQIALAYAQARFSEWLSQNREGFPAPQISVLRLP